MAARRLSRGTPLLYGSKQEQEAGVKAIDGDPEVVRAIEQITGKSWSTMAFGDKVATFDQHNEMGAALAQVVAVERTRRDLLTLAAERASDVTATERLTQVEAELDATRTELRRTEDAYRKLRARAEVETAAPAMAVHS